MCCSAGPAHFSNTILYAAEVHDIEGDPVRHVLGYQNTVENLADGPNAMILPIPAVPGTVSSKNVIDTSDAPNILKDMASLFMPVTRSLGHAKSYSAHVEVFDSGIYTIILAEDARAIPSALKRIRKDKCPSIKKEMFEAYAKWYPGWSIALCCFNNRDAAKATPMMWWYRPANPDRLFAPAVDAHDGNPPDLSAKVAVDHTVIFGSDRMKFALEFNPRHSVPQVIRPYVNVKVVGHEYKGESMKNGDFIRNVKDFQRDASFIDRVSPPGA